MLCTLQTCLGGHPVIMKATMAYIPESAEWYLAEIVEEIIVEGDSRHIVHTNLVLIQAKTPEQAHDKAMELGTAREQSYENPDGKAVKFRFRGLHDLNVIHDKLEHGAELIYWANLDWDESAIRGWVTSKENLGAFKPISRSTGPNYSSGKIMEAVHRMIANSSST
jgi:hypothetical protein